MSYGQMLGQALTLVSYDGEPYALPAWVNGYPWLVRSRLFYDHKEDDRDVLKLEYPRFKAPPPLGDWGSAWWLDWNMTAFNKMLDHMYDVRGEAVKDTIFCILCFLYLVSESSMTGLRNIFTIPPDISETAFYSYVFNHYGCKRYIVRPQRKTSNQSSCLLATIFDAQGHCGMDEKTLGALKQTL